MPCFSVGIAQSPAKASFHVWIDHRASHSSGPYCSV